MAEAVMKKVCIKTGLLLVLLSSFSLSCSNNSVYTESAFICEFVYVSTKSNNSLFGHCSNFLLLSKLTLSNLPTLDYTFDNCTEENSSDTSGIFFEFGTNPMRFVDGYGHDNPSYQPKKCEKLLMVSNTGYIAQSIPAHCQGYKVFYESPRSLAVILAN